MYRPSLGRQGAYHSDVKIATWNVNGIRARAAQLGEWLQRERPDIVCLQELKATAAQIPAESRVADYHDYWHTLKGYSGVSLHVRKDLFAVDPVFRHPPFDMESRIVQVEHGDLVIASTYVPNGGKDYPAKLAFVKSLIDWSAHRWSCGRVEGGARQHDPAGKPEHRSLAYAAGPRSVATVGKLARSLTVDRPSWPV